MRLIDADAIPWTDLSDGRGLCYVTFLEKVQRLPTVKENPVKHGEWIVEYEVKDGRSMRCSECQMVFWVGSGRNGNYCPNCGAKMDAERMMRNVKKKHR